MVGHASGVIGHGTTLFLISITGMLPFGVAMVLVVAKLLGLDPEEIDFRMTRFTVRFKTRTADDKEDKPRPRLEGLGGIAGSSEVNRKRSGNPAQINNSSANPEHIRMVGYRH
jgi:hypothetical protein